MSGSAGQGKKPKASASRKLNDAYNQRFKVVEDELDKLEIEAWPEACTKVGRRACLREVDKDGNVAIKPPSYRSGIWTKKFKEYFPHTAKAAARLLAMHVTSAAAERNWSIWGQVYADARRSSLGVVKAEKLVTIMAHYRHDKLEEKKGDDTLVSMDFLSIEEE